MTEKYKFPCGCEVEILDSKEKDYDGLPILHIDYDDIPLDCDSTWDLFAEGNTKGVFQLESGLGIGWSKKVKPRSIEELSDLVSIIRPGTLDAMLNGKSMTQHYVDRKFGKEDITSLHPSLDDILNKTYGIIVYQEQILEIAKKIAGFDLKSADSLRKAVGKKDSALMAKTKIEFLDGCAKTGIVDTLDAEIIFENIEASARYSFNKSHAVCYAVTAYQTAWAKYHLTPHFFCSWLSYAKEGIDPKEEISGLIRNSKFSNNVDVNLPDIRSIYETNNFYIDGMVYFGLSNISGVGVKKLEKLKLALDKFDKKIDEFSWLELLFIVFPKCDHSVINNLIKAGAFSYLGLQRKVMLYDLNLVNELTERELTFLSENLNMFSSAEDSLRILSLSGICKGKRVTKIAELYNSIKFVMSESLKRDTLESVVQAEKDLLGIAISGSKVSGRRPAYITDTCDTVIKNKDKIIVAAEIFSKRVFKQKNGKNAGKEMAYLTCGDDLGVITVLLFAQKYEEFSALCFEGNTITIYGRTDENSTLIADKLEQI